MKCPSCGDTDIHVHPTQNPRRLYFHCRACARSWLDKPQPLKVKDAFAACRRALTMAEPLTECPHPLKQMCGRGPRGCLDCKLPYANGAIKAARTSMAKAERGVSRE